AWSQQAELAASDGTSYDSFGGSVSLSGDTALVGAKYGNHNIGAAYVFVRSGTIWTQEAQFIPSDGLSGDIFGGSVGLSGNTALIGASNYIDIDGSRAVYVFVRSGTTWNQATKLVPEVDSSGLGASV